MKDVDRETIESGRPRRDTLDAINFCLDALYRDNQKSSSDCFAFNATYEELLGTLLLAKDEIESARAFGNSAI